MRPIFQQRSLDELGVPLADVTFCVLDLETTGSDRGDDLITEIGAIKVRGGECLGTFATLVNPGKAIAPMVMILTGITDNMVTAAPRIESVLASLLEFVGDAVIVGHNVSFDMAFLNAALVRDGRERFANVVIDTLPIARRLVRDEVPDCRLATLATRFRFGHKPTHRALDDALATADLLHMLLERAAGFGVLGLDDLIALPRIGAHPQAVKLRLTQQLPRSPGVYLFHGHAGEVLYVGKATNLRQRVRSYFGSDDRRKIGPLLRETQRVSCHGTTDPVSAEVLEMRYLHELTPRYNKVGTTWQRYCYVRLTTDAWPRLMVVNEPHASGVHIGPLPSKAVANAVIEAVHSVLPLRRCTNRLQATTQLPLGATPCASAQLGVAMCPCAGEADPARYAHVVGIAIAALTDSPNLVLDPLWERVEQLAMQRRYEEAALARDRAQTFGAAVRRQRLTDQLRRAGEVELSFGDVTLRLDGGVLLDVGRTGQLPMALPLAAPGVPALPAPLPRAAADEVLLLARAIDRAGARAKVVWCSGEWCAPTTPVRHVTRLTAA